MIEAELPDGTILEFPDGTDQAVIQKVVKQRLGVSETTPPASAETQPVSEIAPARQIAQQPTSGPSTLLSEMLAKRTAAQAGFIEPAMTIASGMIAEPIAGLSGLVQGGDAGAVQSTREALTYRPRTEAGTQGLKTLGDLVQRGIDIVNFPISGLGGLAELVTGQGLDRAAQAVGSVQEQGLSKTLGERTFDITGDPMAATIAETAPTAVMSIAGAKATMGQANKLRDKLRLNKEYINAETGLPSKEFERALTKRGMDFGDIVKDPEKLPIIKSAKAPDEIVDDIIKKQLIDKEANNYLYQYRLKDGKVVGDDLGKEAVRQGYREGDVAAVKQANDETRREMARMLSRRRTLMANRTDEMKYRPSGIAGDHMMKKFNFIRARANDLRAELDNIAERSLTVGGKNLLESDATKGSALKGLKINASKVEDRFIKEVDRLGIKADYSQGKPVFDFVGSDISKDRTSQRIIKDVTDLLAEPGDVDALRAHKLKRQLDNLIDFNKKSSRGLTESGRNFAKSIRAELNDVIRDVSPKYAKINDELSASIRAMNNFQDALGGKVDVFEKGAGEAVGTRLRALLSNQQGRQALDNAVDEIDTVAKELGGRYDVDVKSLVQFANTLDDKFGATARTSFKGDIESAMKQAVSSPTQAAVNVVVEKAAGKFNELKNINDREAFNVMMQILKRRE